MNLAVNARQTAAADLARSLAQKEDTPAAVTLCAQKWLNHRRETEGSRTTGQALAAALAKAISAGTGNQEELQALYNMRDMFGQKSVWAFGGDGWAYDIGYGGVDHVLASGENINILVLDTEVYSNTGGQASKATNTGAVAQFAAAGKAVQKKDLAAIAMQYGNVYVAQVAMGADYSQTLRALLEAESYPGTSIIIAYAPCISHGIKIGMNNTMLEMKAAVQAGYWHLFRYDPRRKEKGRNPFQLDSPAPIMDYQEFLYRRGPLFLPSAHLPGTGHRALCPGGEGGAGEICAAGRAEQTLGGQGRLSPDWKRIHILKIKIQGDRQCSVKDLPVFLSTTEEVAGREKNRVDWNVHSVFFHCANRPCSIKNSRATSSTERCSTSTSYVILLMRSLVNSPFKEERVSSKSGASSRNRSNRSLRAKIVP